MVIFVFASHHILSIRFHYSVPLLQCYCLFGVKKYFFCIFNVPVASGVSLKGTVLMMESSLLSKEEPLTLDLDGVVALCSVRRRAQQNATSAKHWTSPF